MSQSLQVYLINNHGQCIPISTIRNWLSEEEAGAGAAALPQQASISPSNIPPRVATPLDGIRHMEDHRALHAKGAQLVNRLSFKP
jgi:hypothetical protein